MKNAMLIAAVLCVIAGNLPATAADLAYRYAPPQAAPGPDYASPIYDWNAFYIGAHLGGAFSGNNNFDVPIMGNLSQSRFLGGLQLGADYQFAPNWLVGIEGQYSFLEGRVGVNLPDGSSYSNRQSGLGSVTGRLGYVWGPGMVYAKGGYAYSNNNDRVTEAGVPVAFTTSGDYSNGWTVGTGLEFLVAPNWSAKFEYQYYNFGKAALLTPEIGRFTTDDNTVKLGINYRFNSALWH